VTGNLLTATALVAQAQSLSLLTVINAWLHAPDIAIGLLTASFSPMDLLLYGLAIWEENRLATRSVNPAEPADADPGDVI
jgi:hypothetical protein